MHFKLGNVKINPISVFLHLSMRRKREYMKQGKKITILGAGNVGATIAYALAIDAIASEIVLIDINKDKAKGEAMDIY